MRSSPLAPRDLLRLQTAAGNRAVVRLTRAPARGTASPVTVSRRWLRRANGLLDAVPRPYLRGGLPSFRVAIWAAAATGVAVGAAIAPAAGITVASFVVAALVVLLVVIGALLVHRLPSYSLQLAVLAGALAAAGLLGLDVLATLDVVAVGLGAGQVVGRIGCAMAGCCHGRPAGWGLRYGPAHLALGFPRPLIGVRLAPVQLLEATYCAALTAANVLIIASSAPAGTAFATQAVGYAAGRLGLEWLRGDAGRRSWRGRSRAQWISVAVPVGIVALEAGGALPPVPLHWAVALALPAAAAWARGGPADWSQLAHALDGLPPGAVAETSGGLRVSVRSTGQGWTYGISGRSERLRPAQARAVAAAILRLRHPDRDGLLLDDTRHCDVLIVSREEPA